MTKVKLNVLFKKMQKDDKKEVLMFHVLSDELPHADELLKMPGTIVHLTVEKSDVEAIGAEFVSIILEPSQMSIDEFYEELHEGVEYNVNSDGTTDVAPGQLKIVDGETIAE
ncbi:hypothetical protein [Bacillus toyonensis]|uniref:hypothetical protein n=1 Tax=Bacillus toyonensis TaxID=155322 RepID=UPI000BFB3DBB|nr:hypothetical protein [Bacillus toyonensis]PHG57595.1 hypothetical protein COI59_29680 [Bacillus toyonensis]